MRRRAMKIDRTDAIRSMECASVYEKANRIQRTNVRTNEKKTEEIILCSQITSLFLIVVVVAYAAADTAATATAAAVGNIYFFASSSCCFFFSLVFPLVISLIFCFF